MQISSQTQRLLRSIGLILVTIIGVTVWLYFSQKTRLTTEFVAFDPSTEPGATDFAQGIQYNASIAGDQSTVRVVAAADAPAEIKSIADFVARGSNDQDIIMEAIYSLPASGGVVHLSTGTFWMGDNLEISGVEGIILRGSGWDTVLKIEPEATFTNAGILRVKRSRHITLEDMQIDGNKQNQTVPDNKYGFYSDLSEYIVVRNLYVHDCPRYGIDPHKPTSHITIENNLVENNGSETELYDGITIDGVTHGLIIGNISRNNARNGINIVTDSQYLTIANNLVTDNGGSGIVVQNGSRDVTVTANTVENNAANGIHLKATDNNLVTRNYVALSGTDGIELSGRFNVVEGNYFTNNGQAGSQGRAQAFSDVKLKTEGYTSTQRNTVIGNWIDSDTDIRTRHGVEEFTVDVTYNYILENTIQGQTAVAIRSRSYESILLGNNGRWPFLVDVRNITTD